MSQSTLETTGVNLQSSISQTAVVQPRIDSALTNTRFAADRTLMASVRTSLSLIGFGFTIYKFFESVVHTVGPNGLIRVKAPLRVGATLVSIGLFLLIAATVQHWQFLRQLGHETDQRFPTPISLISAVMLALTGMVILVTMLVRL